MNNNFLKNKLKKYLFFVSIVFFTATAIHLIYNYSYFDSKEKPEEGGTISESFVGKFPSLNPLKYYNDDYNSYINHILYRSLSTYDINKKQIVGDLAECDIKNTRNIKCNITKNIKWSNGENITTEDIAYTYKIIQKYKTNKVLKSILDNIEISTTDTSIIFKSQKQDVNILNILFQPIVSKQILEKLSEDELKSNFSPIDGIYSGKYYLSKINEDQTDGNTKIFLTKNPYYLNNPAYIKNIILKIYKNSPLLLKQKNNINIFLDKNHLIGDSIPRLKEYKYILPQYVGIFINKDKIIYPKLRNYILNSIDKKKILEKIGTKYNKQIDSPFLNNLNLDFSKSDTDIKPILNSLGYYKKDYYVNKYKKFIKNPSLYSMEAKIKKEITLKADSKEIDITKIKGSITKQNYNTHSKIIFEPNWVDKYNFITKPNIVLKGKVTDNIKEVYINDYKLNNFIAGNKEFSYKLSPSIGNIKIGRNNYKIYFVDNSGEKKFIEEINFFYEKNKKTLEKREIDLIGELINKKIEQEKNKLEKQKQQEKTQEKNQLTQEEINTQSKFSKKLKLINSLDDKFYYDKDFEPFTLHLSYIKGSKQIELTSEEIKNQLENIGIKIEIKEKKLIEIAENVKNNKENYDLLLAGINLGYFNFDISRYFYSGQIDKGQNFAKIKSGDLDNILEELKSYPLLDSTSKQKQENAIINIFKKESIFEPIYSPIYSNLVFKDIEGYKLTDNLPKNFYRFDPIINSYILKEKTINKDNKSSIGFFKYLIKNLF